MESPAKLALELHGKLLGQWDFHVCRNPQLLGKELGYVSLKVDQ